MNEIQIDIQSKKKRAHFLQLTPFFVFIGLFSALHIIYRSTETETKSGFALFACLIAVLFSLFTFVKKTDFNKKIQIFISGSAQSIILYMCYIFIFSSVFAHVASRIGGVDAAVKFGLFLIPPSYILPGLFATVSLFAVTIGSSMGSIAAFMPIAWGFSQKLGINPSLIAGLVVGGSMLGDNLSFISDTTLAAARSTGCRMTDKFKANVRLVIPAFILTLIVLYFVDGGGASSSLIAINPIVLSDFIKVIPYIAVFSLALLGIDVLAVLVIGTVCAAGIGMMYNSFTFIEATSFLFEGFYLQPGMVNVLVLVMLIAGLAKIIEYNGGLAYVLEKWQPKIKTKAGAEITIASLVFIINAAIAINTIAILIVGPVAKTIGTHFGIRRARLASILDIFACVCQGFAPYTPQLLLASTIANVSSISVLPYLHYQFIIAIVALLSILRRITQKPRK
jgi:Na+/H+ antiporter NhaC